MSDAPHMTPDEFRRAGHALVDWIADYRLRLAAGDIEVRHTTEPGAVRAALPAHPPMHGEHWSAWIRDLDEIIVPGLTHWQHPAFFAYFPASSGEASVLGELVAAGLATQGMVWDSAPAATELESLVLDWIVEMLALPGSFRSDASGGGVIQDTASTATLTAIAVARHRRARDPVVYASTEAHSSLVKGARIAGVEHVRLVPVDDHRAMRVDALAAMLDEDRRAGASPALVCATVGTTSTGAIDPVAQIAEVTRPCGAWLHVDAAMYGTAAVCEEHRAMHAGIEHADSYVFNPHKWMLVNVNCSAFFVRDRAPLLDAMRILPEYLRNAASLSGGVIDYRDWHPQLGRRFRALKLWFTIRQYGVEGLRAHVRHHVALAEELRRRIAAEASLELVDPSTLSLVCFRHVVGDTETTKIADALTASGSYVTTTRVAGDVVIRVAIGGRYTERSHVDALGDIVVTTARSLPSA